MVESLLVLSIAASLLLLAPIVKPLDTTQHFLNNYDAMWQHSRLLAGKTRTTVQLDITKNDVRQIHEGRVIKRLDLPVSWVGQPNQIAVAGSGYVSPKTIRIDTPRGQLQFIYSIAGGDYRVAWAQ